MSVSFSFSFGNISFYQPTSRSLHTLYFRGSGCICYHWEYWNCWENAFFNRRLTKKGHENLFGCDKKKESHSILYEKHCLAQKKIFESYDGLFHGKWWTRQFLEGRLHCLVHRELLERYFGSRIFWVYWSCLSVLRRNVFFTSCENCCDALVTIATKTSVHFCETFTVEKWMKDGQS